MSAALIYIVASLPSLGLCGLAIWQGYQGNVWACIGLMLASALFQPEFK